MKIKELNGDNYYRFGELVEPDEGENLERDFFRGAVVTDDDEEKPLGGMIWELEHLEEEEPVESRIHWISAGDPAVGEVLLSSYTARVREEGAVKSIASVYVKKNSPELEALKNAGFSMKLSEGDHIMVSLSELSEMSLVKNKKLSDKVKPISDLTQKKFRMFISTLAEKGRKGLCQDLDSLPRSWFENDISCCYEDQEGISGMLLFHRVPSGSLSLKLMFTFGKDKNDMVMKLQFMIRQMVSAAEKLYSPETRIILERHNTASLALSEKLFPRTIGRLIYLGERAEGAAGGKA